MCMSLVRLSDLLQYALVCLVQAFGQLFQDTSDTGWEAVPQDFQLAKHPAEPIHLEHSSQADREYLTFHPLFPIVS